MAFSTKSRSSFNTRFVKSNKLGREKTAINESALGIETTSASKKFDNAALTDQLDSQMGFDRYESGPKKVGWLVNFHSVCKMCFWIFFPLLTRQQ